MSKEEDNKAVLACRQVEAVAGTMDLLRGQVDADIGVAEHGCGSAIRSPDQRPNPSEKLLEGKRFAKVVVGSTVETANTIRDCVACREKENRCGASGLAVTLQECQTVDSGQPPVEKNDVPGLGGEAMPGILALRRMLDGEALLSKSPDQEVRDLQFVFDHEYPDAHRLPLWVLFSTDTMLTSASEASMNC